MRFSSYPASQQPERSNVDAGGVPQKKGFISEDDTLFRQRMISEDSALAFSDMLRSASLSKV